MGALGKLIDMSLFFLFAVLAVFLPLIDGQVLLPGIYPKFLTDLKNWYSSEFNDYLFTEKPHFFVGLIWHELLFQWPLMIANVYAFLTRKSWYGTICLLSGASFVTSIAAALGDIIGSGRVTNRLLSMYLASMGFGIVALLRGLVSHSTKRSPVLARRRKLA
ncbi:hypothetical protein N665_0629s0002 [Sinapis alba]|nr:hypothetical protein N665_0629s0002 [Sinapis alba]